MKSQISQLLILCFLFAFSSAHSEVYSWVDKEGKKHFGEQVPKEYQKQSKAIEVKPVNSMQATEVTEAQTSNRKPAPVYVSPEPDNSQNLSSCEQQKKAYENSVLCYSRCKNNGSGTGYVNNVSACGHCQDLKKPDCEN